MRVSILKLRPTQFAVGMDEVEFRVKEMSKMTPKKLHDYLHSHKVPVIRGPDGLYLIDKHHLIRACWELGLNHVPVFVKADLRKDRDFWNTMATNKWIYVKNQFMAITCPAYLPRTVRGLGDNPWRSLAWKARINNGFVKDPTPFSEFQWAEFFHDNLDSPDDIKGALKLCKSPKAKNLPGAIV